VTVTVSFEYDEEARTWLPVVRGAQDGTEARQAFSAVVLSCMMLDATMLHHTRTEEHSDGYRILPAVRKST